MPARDPLPAPPGNDNRNSQRPRRTVLWLVLAACGLTGLVVFLMARFPGAMDNSFERPRLVYLVLWVAALGASFIVHRRTRPGQVLRYAAIWIAIGAVVMIGYSLFVGRFTGG